MGFMVVPGWRCGDKTACRRYPTLVARTACVSFTDPKRGTYTHVTAGDTLFEAVNRAMNWFADPYWRGPRPGPNTVFEVTLVGDARKWRVTACRVHECRIQQVA